MTNRRKVGMTSSHHGPHGVGYKRATMGGTKGCYPAKGAERLLCRKERRDRCCMAVVSSCREMLG